MRSYRLDGTQEMERLWMEFPARSRSPELIPGEDALIPAWFLLQATTGPSPNPVLNFLPLILIFGIFYFLMLRPMSKQRKDQQRMISELQSGNVVLTNGGIIGTIVSLTDDAVILRVKPDNIKIQIARSAVSSRLTDESQ